jgi:four helix bundle protein
VVGLAVMKRRFEELRCWQMARKYRKAIYAVTRKFPKDELFGLTNQLRRAACSVTANIAEGYGRYSLQDTAQFCVIARGSLNETLDQLYVALDEGYIDQQTFDTLYEQARAVEQVVNGYIAHLRRQGQA